jgi:hypothetical protein
MKKLNDEDIQKLLEGGRLTDSEQTTSEQEEDIKAYKFLFKQLEQEPEMNLPYNFAAKVAATVDVKTKRSNTVQFYLLTVAVTACCLALTYFMVQHFSGHVTTRIGTIIAPYKWILGFVVVVLLTIQFVDQKLIKGSKVMT